MTASIVLLLIITVFFVIIIGAAFWWAIFSGQFDDAGRASQNLLDDNDDTSE